MEQLGRRLKLDVAKPHQKLINHATGESYQIRDEVGLLLDPKLYAKRNCNLCGGEGMLRKRLPVNTEQLAKMVESDPSAKNLVHENTKGRGKKVVAKGNYVTHTSTCGCVVSRYKKAKRKLLQAVDEYREREDTQSRGA